MRSMIAACLVALCFSGGSAATLGCSDCSTSGQDPVAFTDGTLNKSGTIYETMGPMDEMLHFPQGRIYEIPHGMGVDPASVDIFLSFKKQLTPLEDTNNPTDAVKPNNVSATAGNQAVIEAWDKDMVRIRNDTCAEFYMRVVIIADPDEVAAAAAADSENGAAGASGLGGANGTD